MGLYKRGDIWWVSIKKKHFEYVGSTGCTDKENAEAVLAQKIQESRAAKHSVLQLTKDITLSEWFVEYEKIFQDKLRGWNDNTKYSLKRYINKFGHLKLNQITSDLLQKDYDSRLETLEVSSANREIGSLGGMLSRAIKKKVLIGLNPVHGVEKETESASRKRFLYKEEFFTLLNALTPKEKEAPSQAQAKLKLRNICLFAINTGFIESEIQQIKKSAHFNRKERMLWVQDGKTKNRKNVWVKLNDYAFQALDGEVEDQPWDYSWRTVWEKAIEECGFNKSTTPKHDRVVFYTLRHTFISWLLMSGENIYTVAKLARNTVAMIEKHYGHLSKEHHGQSVKVLDTMMPEFSATILLQNKKRLESEAEIIDVTQGVKISSNVRAISSAG